MGTTWTHFMYPGTIPMGDFEESQFDPMFGFEATGRKIRKMEVTDDQMDSHNLPGERRDFCAKPLMEWQKCMHENYPFFTRCAHQYHAYGWCQYDDYVIRMKEYERERRLMARAKRVGPERAGYRVAPVES
ncbi:NADH dehydrogenase [ubiquinone] 1 beta subcomplex subunit 7 [Frankliniella fusca]|uniref:NADH dehydrogenase [ubiquinone] 1 beta subcomplex subunit 7 n=2 Tax=Arthropoda TaxID=6656 RepID=A0AAE1LRV9_9NEOP|nr:NADH dehydrogenase [ubiquinone] 1 beta subcomplex subunit 7 [Frankliniella fusca]